MLSWPGTALWPIRGQPGGRPVSPDGTVVERGVVIRSEERLQAELRALCHGWGLQRDRLRDRVGEHVARWADLPASASDTDIRLLLSLALDRLPGDGLLPDQLLAVRVALAIDSRCRFSSLGR